MQPRVTIQALATVWLVVVSLVGAAVTHRLSHDQYFPASPHRHSRVQRNQIRDWRDHDPAEDQPLDLWIGSRRSISAEEPPALPHSSTKFTEKDFPLEKNNVSSKRDYPFSAWQRWLLNIAGTEFAADKVDYGYEMPQTFSREAVILPSDLLDDPFVADDTFQDQGPGSVEIYKLDLSKENVLLTATTPTNDLLTRNKSKSPKKMSNLNSKTKTTEVKSTMTTPSPKIHHGQSNVFEEQRTETPSVNTNSFGVGGVPELQVGCEGLEASSSSHKAKRSIDTPDKEQRQVPASILQNVTPVVLDLDYDYKEEEEEDEEMDELLKLKKLETTTKRNQPNRGDMDASHLNSDHLDESWRPDKLPVRGDLGESRRPSDTEIKNQEEKAKWMLSVSADDGAGKNRGRRLLWLAEANTEGFAYGKSEQKRAKRSIEWGFGEDEGVVSSNELQTMNARRRKHDMRYHRNAPRKRDRYHEVNSDVDKIRREYEERLAQKRREDEERRLRQQQQGGRSTPSGWMEEEERRRDEMQTRQYEEYFRRMNNIPALRTGDDETLRRQMEEQQRQEAARNRTQEMARRNEEDRRRREEERRRRLQEEKETGRSQSRWQEANLRRMNSRTPYNEQRRQRPDDEEMRRREEEARRQEWYRKQEEAQRRKDEEERKRQEDDRKREEEQLAEKLAERRRQEEEERRRQQPPSNLTDTKSQSRHPNDIERRDPDEDRRAWEQEERRREQKLREYIARNRPINVNRSNRRTEEEKRRYRPEDNRDSRMNANRNAEEYRRQMEEQRRRQAEEQRRKQEEEQRRRQEEQRRQNEEQYRQQEEEKKLQDYIRRNQPVNMRNNQSTSRDLFEERRLIEQARRRDRYPDPGAGRHRGPSVSMYIDPRSSPEEVWRRQQETARRQEEERRRVREREEKEGQLREKQMGKEAARREQEARREQSRRYEEERKRLEATRSREEQRRQEVLRERSKSEAERTRQPEATRRPTSYQDPRLMEHRRRQDSQPIPSNLARNEEERKERERQRQLEQEAERRRQQENRWREHRRKESEQERSRQELARLSSLPVSARIIVRPINFTPSPGSPTVLSRTGIGNEVDFTGINPHREGVKVAKFPVPPTPRPPVPSPRPCVWAVVHCCSSNNSRLTKCFESLGCPGINWDPNPCSNSIVEAARAEVMKFYESQ